MLSLFAIDEVYYLETTRSDGKKREEEGATKMTYRRLAPHPTAGLT